MPLHTQPSFQHAGACPMLQQHALVRARFRKPLHGRPKICIRTEQRGSWLQPGEQAWKHVGRLVLGGCHLHVTG